MSDNCGEERCGVCVRQDGDVFDLPGGRLSLVTYVGEYAVHTAYAPANVGLMLARQFGLDVSDTSSTDPYMTTIGWVKDKSIKDSADVVSDDEYMRYVMRFGIGEDDIRGVHNTVAEWLSEGIIDVSEPMDPEVALDQMYDEG